jgi:hypothetical protein
MSWSSLNPLNVINGVVEIFKMRNEQRINKEIASAKVKQATIEGQTQLEMTSAQWEALAVQQTENSWKDEYVTIVITSPLLLLLIGGVYGAITGDTRIIVGAGAAIEAIESTGVELGFLMNSVVLAAIGLKFWRK